MADGVLTLDLAREGRRLKISFFEGGDKALRPYVSHEASWEQIDANCRELLTLLGYINRSSTFGADLLNRLKKTGQILFDLLIPPQIKEKLATTSATIVTLRLEDTLVQIPWELIHDGENFFCRRFATGRLASTSQTLTARSTRMPTVPFNVLVLADPRGDLAAAYQEGLEIKRFLDARRNRFRVDFKSQPADIAYVKKNLRDYDIVHYAGHVCYDDANPSNSGWLLSDGTLRADEIAAMGGLEPMPALLFVNGCASGLTDEWKNGDQEQPIFGLANAFLLSGVRHYIGTFREFTDQSHGDFATHFYAAAGDGESIGKALRSARRAQMNGGQGLALAWTNYMLYGDPAACLKMPIGEKSQSQKVRWKEYLEGLVASGPSGDRSWRAPALFSVMGILLLASGFGGYSLWNSDRSEKAVIRSRQVTSTLAISPRSATQSPASAPLTLAMNIIGQRKEPDGRFSEVIVREGSVLQSRDHFQVHLETSRPAYVYVLLFDSDGRASQLFPDPKIEQPGFVEAGRRIPIPNSDLWFWLDERPGTETVYVLASEEPLADIRDLLAKMNKAGETERKRVSGRIKERIEIVERGVGGVAKGKTESYPLSDVRHIHKITEVVVRSGALVRAISFEHR